MKINFISRITPIVLFSAMVMQSCTEHNNEEVLNQKEQSPNYTVRPDFASIDNRPTDEIEAAKVTGEFTQPVALNTLKSKGKYALVIGISDYEGYMYDLEFCDEDARDWRKVLRNEGYEVVELLDLEATKANINKEINKLASLANKGSEIAFCYSGHGSEGSIITADLFYVGHEWFDKKFQRSKCEKMFFCFDACEIGKMKRLGRRGRIVTVASDEVVYAYDGDDYMQNGVFTYYMMEGFKKKKLKFLEDDSEYAVKKMKEWGDDNWVDVAPSYKDSYKGKFKL